MTYRSIAVVPFVLAAVAAAALFLVPASAQGATLQVEVDASKLVAFAGMAAAALAFEPGDYLRRGWGTWAAAYIFLTVRDAVLLCRGHISPLAFDVSRGVLVTAGNACVVFAAWTLARAWGVAGLEHPGSKNAKRAAVGIAIIAVLLLAGPIFVVDLRELLSGRSLRIDAIASDLGDILALPLIAPVALTALAVQGGTLRWPWTLLTASLVAWLLYDTIYTVPDYFAVPAAPLRLASEPFHVLAAACACAAGLAQRKAVTDDDDAEPEG